MRKIVIAMTIMLSTAILTSASVAQMGGRGLGGHGMNSQAGRRSTESQNANENQTLDMAISVPDFLLIDLNLTNEQTSQITILRDSLNKEVKLLKEDAFAKRANLSKLLAENSLEQEKIADLRKEIKEIRDRIIDKTAQYLQLVRNILSLEQRFMLRFYWRAWDIGHNINSN